MTDHPPLRNARVYRHCEEARKEQQNKRIFVPTKQSHNTLQILIFFLLLVQYEIASSPEDLL
jgi:hypothetical protein